MKITVVKIMLLSSIECIMIFSAGLQFFKSENKTYLFEYDNNLKTKSLLKSFFIIKSYHVNIKNLIYYSYQSVQNVNQNKSHLTTMLNVFRHFGVQADVQLMEIPFFLICLVTLYVCFPINLSHNIHWKSIYHED